MHALTPVGKFPRHLRLGHAAGVPMPLRVLVLLAAGIVLRRAAAGVRGHRKFGSCCRAAEVKSAEAEMLRTHNTLLAQELAAARREIALLSEEVSVCRGRVQTQEENTAAAGTRAANGVSLGSRPDAARRASDVGAPAARADPTYDLSSLTPATACDSGSSSGVSCES